MELLLGKETDDLIEDLMREKCYECIQNITLNRLEECFFLIKSIHKYIPKIKDLIIGEDYCKILYTLADYYFSKRDLVTSISLVNSSYTLISFTRDQKLISKICILTSKIYSKQKNFVKAVKSIKALFDLTKEMPNNNTEILSSYFSGTEANFKIVAEKYEKAGDYKKAFEFYLHYFLINLQFGAEISSEFSNTLKASKRVKYSKLLDKRKCSDISDIKRSRENSAQGNVQFPKAIKKQKDKNRKLPLRSLEKKISESNCKPSFVSRQSDISTTSKLTVHNRTLSHTQSIIVSSPPRTPENLFAINFEPQRIKKSKIKRKSIDIPRYMLPETKITFQSIDIPKYNVQNFKKLQMDKPKDLEALRISAINNRIRQEKLSKEDFIPAVIKIQAFYRCHIKRELYKLIKTKKNIVKTGVKMINNIPFHIRVISNEKQLTINAFNGSNNYKLTLPSTLKLEKIIPGLSMSEQALITFSENAIVSVNYKFIQKSIFRVGNDSSIVMYSKHALKNDIKAELEWKGARYELHFSKTADTHESLNTFIDQCIHDYLYIENDKLLINYNKEYTRKELIYKGYKKSKKHVYRYNIYKVITSTQIEIEVFLFNLGTGFWTYTFFPLNTLIAQLDLSYLNETNSYLLFASLEFATNMSITNTHKTVKFIGSRKSQLGSCDYILRMFTFKDKKKKYLFECINPDMPSIASIVESQQKIKKTFNLSSNKISKSFPMILNALRIKDGKLVFVPAITKRNTSEFLIALTTIIKIQRLYRQRRIRDKLQLENTNNILLMTEVKIIDAIRFYISIFKLKWGLLIEITNTVSSEISYKFIEEPRKYVSALSKFSDLVKLIQAIRYINHKIVITRVEPILTDSDPNNSYFIEGPFLPSDKIASSGWPIFMKKEIHGIEYILQGCLNADKSLVISFIPINRANASYSRLFKPKEIVKVLGNNDPEALMSCLRISYGQIITSDVFTLSYTANVSEMLESKIICKVCVRHHSNMYLICASINPNEDNYDESELVFYARLNSSLESCRKTSIKLALGAQISGYSKDCLTSMCEFIAKNMIVVTIEEFYIDCSRPCVDFSQFITKMQAFFRGYYLRKSIRVQLSFIFKSNFKISEMIFSVLIYQFRNHYYLVAIRNLKISKIEVTKHFIKGLSDSQDQKKYVLTEIIVNLRCSTNSIYIEKDANQMSIRRNTNIFRPQLSSISSLRQSFIGGTNIFTSANLLYSHKILINHVAYGAKIYDSENKYYLELTASDSNSTLGKFIKKDIGNIEGILKRLHVDWNHGKIYIEIKVLYNELVMIGERKISLIIYENKVGCYADGFVLDSKKSYHFFLGERIRIPSILSRLRITSTTKGEKLVLKEY